MEYKTKNMNLQLFAGMPNSGDFICYLNNVLINESEIIGIQYVNAYGYDSTGFYISNSTNAWTMSELKTTGGKIPNSDNIINISREYREEKYDDIIIDQPLVSTVYSSERGITVIYITTFQGATSTINLTNCTCNKSNESGLMNSYTATIIANSGYYLSSVTCSDSTAEVTISSGSKTATVYIPNLSSDFSITAIGSLPDSQEIQIYPKTNNALDYTTNLYPKINVSKAFSQNTVSNGTIAKVIGFDSQGNLVKEDVATKNYIDSLF